MAIAPAEHVQSILTRLEETRSSWRGSNIEAETFRYFREVGSGATTDPETIDAVIQSVKDASVSMTPELGVPLPQDDDLLRRNGTSIYLTANREVYTSTGIIANEKYLLDAAATSEVIPAASREVFEKTLQAAQDREHELGREISPAQANMAREFVTSERLLAVGIGPAGAGKTTLSKVVVDSVAAEGHTVYGVAPTAAAADVMAKGMGIEATTVDAFLNPKASTRAPISTGDVIMVDEIGMAPPSPCVAGGPGGPPQATGLKRTESNPPHSH